MEKHISRGIIGMGWVGSGAAIAALHDGIARELLFCDTREELALGEAINLAFSVAKGH